MKVEKDKVVTLIYQIHVGERILEEVGKERPLTYCHGEQMITSWVEQLLSNKEQGLFDEPIEVPEGHPLYGQDIRFSGEILEIRDVMDWELDWIRHPEQHRCGGCHGACHGEGKGSCDGNCKQCKTEENGKHTCNCGKA